MKKALLGAIAVIALAVGVFAVPALQNARASASRDSHIIHAATTTCPFGNWVSQGSSTKDGTLPASDGVHIVSVKLKVELWGIFSDYGDGHFCGTMKGTTTATFQSCNNGVNTCFASPVTVDSYLVYRLANGAYTTSPLANTTDVLSAGHPQITATTSSYITTCAATGGDASGTSGKIHTGMANVCS